MQPMIGVVIAKQLHFLDADGGKHRQRGNAVGSDVGQIQCHSTTHAKTHDVSTLNSRVVQQLSNVVGVRSDGVIGNAVVGMTKSRQVGNDQTMRLGKLLSQGNEVATLSRTTV